ncbi:nucleotidyltransferase domain-containing protein [Candidatus Falkowbacteria bacterium]|nr:MAG: nucleotidyltransferase domain-containing protein [Candidatus Falkowbacteria bacterium]
MNNETKQFLEELKQRSDVLGVILFGSWARGNNRPDSDVDLVVILTEGYRRTVEYKDKQAFEIIYTTEKSVADFWESHKDDCYGLWEVARILYDKDGIIERLKIKASEIIKQGKKVNDPYQVRQYKFSSEDEIGSVAKLTDKDSATANLVLFKTVYSLTELFFDLRQLWTPAPKQRMAKIKELSPEFYSLLFDFYKDKVSSQERIGLAQRMISLVFPPQNI